jgi:hypothetical protein
LASYLFSYRSNSRSKVYTKITKKCYENILILDPNSSSVRLLISYFRVLNFADPKIPIPSDWNQGLDLLCKMYETIIKLTNEIRIKLANKNETSKNPKVEQNDLLASFSNHISSLKSMKIICFGKGKISTVLAPGLFQKQMRPIVSFLIDVFTNIKGSKSEMKIIDLSTDVTQMQATLNDDLEIKFEDIGYNTGDRGDLDYLADQSIKQRFSHLVLNQSPKPYYNPSIIESKDYISISVPFEISEAAHTYQKPALKDVESDGSQTGINK